MLYDGTDEIKDHTDDLISRLNNLTTANGRVVSAYNNDDFYSTVKAMRYPAIGVFYTGMTVISTSDRRSEAAELTFNLVIVDDSKGSTPGTTDTTNINKLTSKVRQLLKTKTLSTQKSWVFKSETTLDLGEKNKVAYVQRWTAIVTSN